MFYREPLLTTESIEISPTHFKTVVLGDLPVDEAFEFYLNELKETAESCETFRSELFDVDFESFKKNVFSMTGGRMWFISDYILQVHSTDERIESPIDFQAVMNEVNGLRLRRRKCKDYTEKDFNLAIKQLADSPSGYMSCQMMINQLSEEKVSALIRDNVLHYRPQSKLARDLIPLPEEDVVTAPSQPALLAMKYLLSGL